MNTLKAHKKKSSRRLKITLNSVQSVDTKRKSSSRSNKIFSKKWKSSPCPSWQKFIIFVLLCAKKWERASIVNFLELSSYEWMEINSKSRCCWCGAGLDDKRISSSAAVEGKEDHQKQQKLNEELNNKIKKEASKDSGFKFNRNVKIYYS